MFTSPITYIPDFLSIEDADNLFTTFLEYEWEERTTARKELFLSHGVHAPYTYGKGDYARTYIPHPMKWDVGELSNNVAAELGYDPFELCFLNRYDNAQQALGWHSDDADSIDHSRPIVVCSFGAERDLWIKPIGGTNEDVEKITLAHGSMLVMKPGMQQTHFHRIPKHHAICATRISVTFRGYLDA